MQINPPALLLSAGLAIALEAVTQGGASTSSASCLPATNPISVAVALEVVLVSAFRFVDDMDDVISILANQFRATEPPIAHVPPMDPALDAFSTAIGSATSGAVLLGFSGA